MGKAEEGLNFICLYSGLCKCSNWLGGFSVRKKEGRKVCLRTPREFSLQVDSVDQIQAKLGWRNRSMPWSDVYLFQLGQKPSCGSKRKGDNGKTQRIRKTVKLQFFGNNLASPTCGESNIVRRQRFRLLRLRGPVPPAQNLAPSLTSCVILGQSLSLSVPQFPHLRKG